MYGYMTQNFLGTSTKQQRKDPGLEPSTHQRWSGIGDVSRVLYFSRNEWLLCEILKVKETVVMLQ